MIKALIPFLIAGTAIAMYFMFISPKLDDIKLLKEEEATFDVALAQTLELDRIQERLESDFNKLSKENLAKLDKLLAGETDPVRLIYDIGNIVEKHNKKISDVSIDRGRYSEVDKEDDQLESEPVVVNVSFIVNATYNELLALIQDLEKSLKIVDISSIDFSIQEDSSGQSLVPYVVNLRTYSLR